MKTSDKYVKQVVWSDEDQCYVGTAPELMYGGCHGDDKQAVFKELCEIVEDVLAMYEAEGMPLPEPDYRLTESPRPIA